MSIPAFHDIAQLRFWGEEELEYRDLAQREIVACARRALQDINRAWTVERVEGPMLTPRDLLSPEYTEDDLWTTPVSLAGQSIVLRAETTASTYAYVRSAFPRETLKMPAAFWQVGKSFRREKQSTAARLRFFEFTQLEMQCLYSLDTKADYRARVLPALMDTLAWLTRSEARVVESDRLPSYAESTFDIEVFHAENWREMASISIRNDFSPNARNLEVAVGLDRIVAVAGVK